MVLLLFFFNGCYDLYVQADYLYLLSYCFILCPKGLSKGLSKFAYSLLSFLH